MSYTITFGWWAIPAVLTLVFFTVAISKFSGSRGDYSFPEVWNGLMLLLALVPSLVVWLIWALVA